MAKDYKNNDLAGSDGPDDPNELDLGTASVEPTSGNKVLAIAFATTLLFSGCMGFSDNNEPTTDGEDLDDWDVFYVSSGTDLPNCNSETLGRLYYVADSETFEVCLTSGWSFIEIVGSPGEQGPQGEQGDVGEEGEKGQQGDAGQDIDPALVAQLQNDNAALSELVTSLESDLINATTCQLVPFKSNTSSVSEAPVGDGGGGPADPATNGTFDPLNPVIEQFEIPFEYGNCARANLSGADLSGMDLTGIVLRSANLEGANLSAARLNESLLMNIEGNSFTNFSNAYLRYADLTDAYLVSADLTGADLRYADLTGADLRYADLTDADLYRADLTGAYLFDADLTGANLESADLTDANLGSADLTDANLGYADLTDAILSSADLTGANLQYADLTDAILLFVDLTDAYLYGADLTYANLRYADLKFADFTSATVTNTNFDDTYWHQTIWTDGDRYDSNQA